MKFIVLGGTGFLGRRVKDKLLECSDNFKVDITTGHDLREEDDCLEAVYGADVVINCAAHQGGIGYQKIKPYTIFRDNMLMTLNSFNMSMIAGVGKYVNIIAGCAYPGDTIGKLVETELTDGPLHPTVENYGIVKRAAVIQGQTAWKEHKFPNVNLIMTNLYGPREHFHPDKSHGLAALLKKIYDAKRDGTTVSLWGTGRAVRDWLYVDDAAQAIVEAAVNLEHPDPINIGSGIGIEMSDLAITIAGILNYQGKIHYDSSYPDGALFKVFDTTIQRHLLPSWTPKTTLRDGIKETAIWLDRNYDEATRR